jgi:hypothetical protein
MDCFDVADADYLQGNPHDDVVVGVVLLLLLLLLLLLRLM